MPALPGGAASARLAALVAVWALLAGCAQSSSAGEPVPGADVAEQGYVSVDGTTTIVAGSDRRMAPALVGTTLSGKQFALADHLGEVVVLNVWASWCAPCRSEADDMAAVARQVKAGATFVGLNTRDSGAPAQAFVDRFAVPYDSVVDTDGQLQLLFHDSLPPAAIPSTLVIDRQGRVAARAIGEVDRSRLLGLLEPIMAEGTGTAGAEQSAPELSGAEQSGSQRDGAGDS